MPKASCVGEWVQENIHNEYCLCREKEVSTNPKENYTTKYPEISYHKHLKAQMVITCMLWEIWYLWLKTPVSNCNPELRFFFPCGE